VCSSDLALFFSYLPVKARSVPPSRSTRYCSGVNRSRHSASVRCIFSGMWDLLCPEYGNCCARAEESDGHLLLWGGGLNQMHLTSRLRQPSSIHVRIVARRRDAFHLFAQQGAEARPAFHHPVPAMRAFVAAPVDPA